MESFGAILRKRREEKNIGLDTVSRDTIISKQYLEALENENIDIFPGDTYVTGFLRNYGEYLGLDSAYLVKLFHGKRMQESPVPENLIIKRHINKKVLAAAVSGGVCLLALCTFLFVYFLVIKPNNKKYTAVDLKKENGQSYTVSAVPLQRRLYKKDTIIVPLAEKPVALTVDGTLNKLTLKTPIGVQYVELGEELEMDVDGSGTPDIVLFLSDVSKDKEDAGAEVRMFVKAGSEIALADETSNTGAVAVESGEALKDGTKYKLILQDNRAYPFTITASFRGVCLYRYKSDRNESVENLLTSGDTLKVSAHSALRLWTSNANTVKMQVTAEGKTYDLDIGRPGQVLVEDVRWIKEADGTYKLTVSEVD